MSTELCAGCSRIDGIQIDGDERSFQLNSELFLSFGKSLDQSVAETSFTWADLEGDSLNDEFEFMLNSKKPGEGIEFERLAWRSIWEFENDKDWPTDKKEAAAVEATLEELYKT